MTHMIIDQSLRVNTRQKHSISNAYGILFHCQILPNWKYIMRILNRIDKKVWIARYGISLWYVYVLVFSHFSPAYTGSVEVSGSNPLSSTKSQNHACGDAAWFFVTYRRMLLNMMVGDGDYDGQIERYLTAFLDQNRHTSTQIFYTGACQDGEHE